MSVSVSDGFLIYCTHLPWSEKNKTSPIKPERKAQGGILRPLGGCHPQVTKLDITLSLDTERLIKARDRGRTGAREEQDWSFLSLKKVIFQTIKVVVALHEIILSVTCHISY